MKRIISALTAALLCVSMSTAVVVQGGDPEEKIHLLMDFTEEPRDVADPWYTGDFEATWRDVFEGCSCLLEQLRPISYGA